MLRWTAAGAVSEPSAVQIRMAPRFAGRVRAGAPAPARDLSLDELDDNVRWFAVDRVGPRSPACTVVVLSGVADGAPVARRVAAWRTWGVDRVVWHLGEGQWTAELGGEVDVVVRTVRSAEGALAASAIAGTRQLVVPLSQAVMLQLDELVDALEGVMAERVVLQWPFPGDGAPPPPADQVSQRIRAPIERLVAAGHTVGVKGLPPCSLSPSTRVGAWADRVWRTRNRWYVDSDHQRDRALVFFPDLARYTKLDSCRFCAASRRCDGVLEPWLAMGLAGSLSPMHTG